MDDTTELAPFYSKVPEIKLRVHDPIGNDTGQCVRFNWNEKFKYVAAGYGSGMIALFNLLSTSKLLRKRYEDTESNEFTEIFPIWYVRAHTETISAIFFHPTNPRFVVTTSYDYYIKTWDTELKSEIESKKIGMVLDACWIRGWITCAASVEYINTIFQIGAYNNIRFYPVGNSKSFTGCADHFNISSISFYEGMVAQGSEMGKVTISFFDQFLRECDYDRNKKKRNTVDFSLVSIDTEGETVETEEAQDPKITITLTKHRRESAVLIPDPTSHNAEEYNVYYNFIRVNKVLWCPTGNQLGTGYHNAECKQMLMAEWYSLIVFVLFH
ncbi:unnamed protein product [Allacma fusca]|uniref:Uncharacterized protein n=1 Tax=Allacma fusca TaxID=39272 RepID=A0A8J2KAN1_9HEXA|nr:unnamed protein product [Allacma fusca]